MLSNIVSVKSHHEWKTGPLLGQTKLEGLLAKMVGVSD